MLTEEQSKIYSGTTPLKLEAGAVTGDYVSMLNDSYYRIRNYDAMPPFFMTLISSANHWLFISTTGGLSAGRVDANHALFPYYTVDKLTENHDNTGNKAILLVTTETGRLLWEPLSSRYPGAYAVERNLYKNVLGTSILFEEINHDLGLIYRYAWRTSEQYGFVKTTYLINQHDTIRTVEIIDGIQNVLPAHVTSNTQSNLSNLLDAYKYSERHAQTGLGLFSLSSRLTDLAEPSESLRTNTVWQVGLGDVGHLLSSRQLDAFRRGKTIHAEDKIRGARGAYFVHSTLELAPNSEQTWHIVADVDQDSSTVRTLIDALTQPADDLIAQVEDDIASNQRQLNVILNAADAMQVSSDSLSTAHHLANVLFNVMRGGIFVDHYNVDTLDFKRFITVHRPVLLESHAAFFAALPAQITISALREKAEATQSPDLIRLCYSYLPLTFSRRHGDPSRPWNFFQINLKQVDGSQRLDYQGNWRDIFQNWEALSYSYPAFIYNMISVFLNATTADGYNPYRLTRNGIDWEVPEPDNEWANIGYWSDHQIIYLTKLLEVCEQFYPGTLNTWLNQRIFSAADVPYTIKAYDDLVADPYNTIDFNWDKEALIQDRVAKIGADGKLVHDVNGQVFHTSLTEKLLLLLLAKLINFVPEGGIWMNTQRPEWNDANNALVGKGLSVVTLAYMRRYVDLLRQLLANADATHVTLSGDVSALFKAIHSILVDHNAILEQPANDEQRRAIMDALGAVGSAYRWKLYRSGVSSQFEDVTLTNLSAFLKLTQDYIEQSLRANKRADDLYHAYNVLHLTENSAQIGHLDPMLEGQVAILSSGLLAPDEVVVLLQALRQSDLYRADQHSYILYPNRQLDGFLDKNNIPDEAVQNSRLMQTLLTNNEVSLITRDVNGAYHFQGDIRNANEVASILEGLRADPKYAALVAEEEQLILDVFEDVFNHAAFTGRSGTFFAYEGLGSIYWHMVSKLLLAVQENVLAAAETGADEAVLQALQAAYFNVRAGIGFNKTPDVYGAFPTDPYSHTPWGQGAKQPGMTGMVKEEILTRFVELGITIEDGAIVCNPILLRQQEALTEASTLDYIDVHGQPQQIAVPAGAIAFTFCQTPFMVTSGDKDQFTLHYVDGTKTTVDGNLLPAQIAQSIFKRDGQIQQVTMSCTG